jgi:flagellar biosynthetic protein FliS
MNLRAARLYKRVDLESAPKPQILDRLYARLVADIDAATAAIEARDVAGKAAAIDHALRIVAELSAALDHRAAPGLCANLDALYAFVGEQLTAANQRLEVTPLASSRTVVAELRAAFQEIQ